MEVDPKERLKKCINLKWLSTFNILPFGLTNAQSLSEHVKEKFYQLCNMTYLLYLDIINCETFGEHLI